MTAPTAPSGAARALGGPPTTLIGTPVIEHVAAGTEFFRVHRATFTADSFNPTRQPSVLAGGRFDSLDGDYGYTYVAEMPDGAIAETLCRDLPLTGAPREVPRSDLRGRRMSTVVTTRTLPVLKLHGAALTQVGATPLLTKCEAHEYLTTRAWARSLRAWLPNVAGFKYRCRHDEDQIALVLFDDLPPSTALRARGGLAVGPRRGYSLESAAGLSVVKRVLRQQNATLG